MSSFALGKPLPRPSLIVFVALQSLDVLTTLIGLQMGASEGSMFIGNLMRVGPVAGLLISKIFAVVLISIALKFNRPRVVVFLNYWSAAVVSWNLLLILMSGFGRHG
jgi:Domain of unknown function (DUF5658)